MQNICKMPGCQIAPNENLADYSWEGLDCTKFCSQISRMLTSGMSQTKPLTSIVKAKNAKVHLTMCDKPV